MADQDTARHGFEGLDDGFKEFEVVTYVGDFRVVGVAHFGLGLRSSSRRASDYIRQIRDNRLTLSQVRIYDKNTQELIETAPFVLINMEKVDFMYARDDSESAPA